MKTWTHAELAELSNLFHLAATALAGTGQRPSRYDRRCWAADQYSKAHPEVSSTAAYKRLCQDDAWRGC